MEKHCRSGDLSGRTEAADAVVGAAVRWGWCRDGFGEDGAPEKA